MSKTKTFSLMIGILLLSLACMTTAGGREDGSAPPAADTPAASITGVAPPNDWRENPAGEVFEVPAEWSEPAGYNLCAVVTASQALHLRSEPTETAQVTEWLLAGEQVEVIEPGGDWWKVRTIAGLEGWAKAKYLREEKCTP